MTTCHRSGLLLVAALMLGGCPDHKAAQPPAPPALPSGFLPDRSADAIADSYLVMLRPGTAPDAVEAIADDLIRRHGGDRAGEDVFTEAFQGFGVRADPAAAQAMSRDPRVQLVEQDVRVRDRAPPFDDQLTGLDRVDQSEGPLSCTFRTDATGRGVNVYVLDTAIYAAHDDFKTADGRGSRADLAIRAANVPDCDQSCKVNGDCDGGQMCDVAAGQCVGLPSCLGHGTAAASLVAGRRHGLAPDALVHSVCVSGCDDGSNKKAIAAGLEYVLRDVRRRKLPSAVVNTSIGPLKGASVATAIRKLIAANVTLAFSGSNLSENTCTELPATFADTLISGWATDRGGRMGSFGPCVDVYAPSDRIPAAAPPTWPGILDATTQFGGNSGASPMIAGVAATILERAPATSPADVQRRIVAAATRNGVVENQLPTCAAGAPPTQACVVDRLLFSRVDLRDSLSVAPSALTLRVAPGGTSAAQTVNVASSGRALEFRVRDPGGCCLRVDPPPPPVPASRACEPRYDTPLALTITADLTACTLAANPCVTELTVRGDAPGAAQVVPLTVTVELAPSSPPTCGADGLPGNECVDHDIRGCPAGTGDCCDGCCCPGI